jgi:hypothetical protein
MLFQHSWKQMISGSYSSKSVPRHLSPQRIIDEHALAEMEKVNPFYHLMGRNTPPSMLTAL